MLSRKRGWIRVVEAFVAVLLIVGVLLFVINKGYIGKKDSSRQIYDAELSILREIELDDNLRTEILNLVLVNEGVVVNDTNLHNVYSRIKTRPPEYLECEGKVCPLDQICIMDKPGKSVYAQAIAISATNTIYKPRQLKMFCWMKD